jgi:hypothetical protein
MTPRLATVILALSALASAGCGASGPPVASNTTAHPPGPTSTTLAAPSHRRAVAKRRAGSQHLRRLVYSTAGNHVVQRQPAAGTCHATGTGPYARPDPACTPGALNPAVTQGTIDATICVPGWTDTVRPAESITEPEKAASMAAYGDTGSTSEYEYDHFVPLELGGATNDARNLWPEPEASPNPKDAVEDQLRQSVCDRQIPLAQAQREIARNWTALAVGQGPAPSRAATSRASGQCTVTASYNSTYRDYDVYVRSNQPDRPVTVTDSAGDSDRWHTDSTGYADVYFHPRSAAAGGSITAHVGTATCYGRL